MRERLKPSQAVRQTERLEAVRLYKDQKKIIKIAAMIPDQHTLNLILLDCPSRIMRREIFEMYKPHVKLFTPVLEGETASYHRRD